MRRSPTESKVNLPSAVEPFVFEGRGLYIKRDDLIDKDLSGNKFRKLYTLLNTPSHHYRRIISYGGSQSNAMASIAALCRRKGWAFLYITKRLSSTLREDIDGNLKAALSDGMELLEIAHDNYAEVISSLYAPSPDSRIQKGEGDLLLAQGGADMGAEAGIALLADEIAQWKREKGIETLTVVTPSGTGTTSYFLAKQLPGVSVLTTPLVGERSYLLEQMNALGAIPSNLIVVETEKRYRFAKPYKEYLQQYQSMQTQGIEIDLLYAPKMLIALSEQMQKLSGEILYLHSGGLLGNSSMLRRYRHKKLC